MKKERLLCTAECHYHIEKDESEQTGIRNNPTNDWLRQGSTNAKVLAKMVIYRLSKCTPYVILIDEKAKE